MNPSTTPRARNSRFEILARTAGSRNCAPGPWVGFICGNSGDFHRRGRRGTAAEAAEGIFSFVCLLRRCVVQGNHKILCDLCVTSATSAVKIARMAATSPTLEQQLI